jgi:hypothetical protein
MCKQSLHVHAKPKAASPRLADPTNTLMLRKRYETAIVNRFRRLKAEVVKWLEYHLTEPGKMVIANAAAPDVLAEFVSWLNRRVDETVLGVKEREGADITNHEEWQREHVEAAYSRGVLDGKKKLKRVGISIGASPMEVRGLGGLLNYNRQKMAVDALLARNFEELKGVTASMAQGLTRTMADALAGGWNPRKTAREMVKNIEDLSIKRARLIARTETIRAYSDANLSTFEQFGADGVSVQAEILTAGDGRVCDKCAGLERSTKEKPLTIEQARGIIPRHPSCRCAWLPYIEGQSKKR